jgi:uncharacterized membrane protein
MDKGRMEAFSDGIIAVAITIMVLDMKVPEGADLKALAADTPVFLAYGLSYTNVGIFWNNHHHMLQAAKHVDGRAMWANLFLLFWLTLVPFVLRWVDDTHVAALPAAAYGFVLLMAAIGYLLLERELVRVNGEQSNLARAIGAEWKARGSMVGYLAGALLAFWSPWASIAIYVIIAAIWFIPDRRIETRLKA